MRGPATSSSLPSWCSCAGRSGGWRWRTRSCAAPRPTSPPTLDVPVVVVTPRVPTDWVEAHPAAPFTFVTDGVEAAIARAQELACDRVVTVAGGTIARQCLDLGLLDGVAVDLVHVVMGEGNRLFFGRLSPEGALPGGH